MAAYKTGWIMLGLFIMTALGCGRWIDVTPSTTPDAASVARTVSKDERVPLVMEGLQVVQNGAPQHPSSDLERRLLTSVQETRLFSTVIPLGGDSSFLSEKTVTARMTLEETIDPRSGASAWKGFLVGASMFLLAPLIELDYGYAAQATLELERWDGDVRRYEAASSGTARYHLFGATPILFDELKGQVTETCLQDLMRQLIRDGERYLAGYSSSPPAIRTVTVGARKSVSRSGENPAVPIAINPAP